MAFDRSLVDHSDDADGSDIGRPPTTSPLQRAAEASRRTPAGLPPEGFGPAAAGPGRWVPAPPAWGLTHTGTRARFRTHGRASLMAARIGPRHVRGAWRQGGVRHGREPPTRAAEMLHRRALGRGSPRLQHGFQIRTAKRQSLPQRFDISTLPRGTRLGDHSTESAKCRLCPPRGLSHFVLWSCA